MSKTTRKSANKFVRDITEVRRIFDDFDRDQSGYIEPEEFLPLLSRLLRQPKSQMDLGEVWRHWEGIDTDGSGKVSFDELSTWYGRTFGVDCSPDFTKFFSDEMISGDQVQIRHVARKFGVGNVEIEMLWKEFKSLDADNSGSLEYDEFKELLRRQLLKSNRAASATVEVPPKILNKFWQDIDADGSGSVNFEEFTQWYLRFFHGGVSPMEHYYQSIGRVSLRQHH